MNDAQKLAAQWLRASRAGETQETLAADIERATGWHITRDRYSKYESGSLPMGSAVLARFVDYWASRGKPGPDTMSAPDAVTAGADAYIARIDALSETISALVEELRLTRQEQAEWNRGVADVLQALGARAFGAPTDGPASEPPEVAPRGRSA